jgi:ParB family chromosome partitioning protein
MRDGFISMGHGRALINIDKKKEQIAIYEKVVSDGLSVRDTEQLVKSLKNPQNDSGEKKPKSSKTTPGFVSKGMDELKEYLSTKVDVTSSQTGKGKIVIPFHSQEEFQRIKKLLTGE